MENLEQILLLVDEAFSEEISASASETILGLESHVEGKEEFLKTLRTKLEQLK